MSQPILSILTPSIPSRNGRLMILGTEIKKQISQLYELPAIEWVFDNSAAFLEGGMSIGEKRSALVERANGEYVCFLDDDEWIAPNYVETLVRGCMEGPDVVTFCALVKLINAWGVVEMNLRYTENEQFTPERIVRRPPWHTCPVKSEYAKAQQFLPINNAEDFEWMQRVLRSCNTQVHTDAIVLQYNHGAHSEADRITHHQN